MGLLIYWGLLVRDASGQNGAIAGDIPGQQHVKYVGRYCSGGRESQFSSKRKAGYQFYKQSMSGSGSFLFIGLQFGLFLLQISLLLEGSKLVIQHGLAFLLAVNFLFLQSIRQHFQFLLTLSTHFYLLDNFIMDISSRSIFNLKVSVTCNISFCSFSNSFFRFFFSFIPIQLGTTTL